MVQNVVPIAVTAAESVERLRNWASGRAWMLVRRASISGSPGGLAKHYGPKKKSLTNKCDNLILGAAVCKFTSLLTAKPGGLRTVV